MKENIIYCNGKCSQCHKYVQVVPDKMDPTNNNVAVFCSNPNNNMEKEWTSISQRQKIMNNSIYANYINKNHWTFIAGMLRVNELDKVRGGNVEM